MHVGSEEGFTGKVRQELHAEARTDDAALSLLQSFLDGLDALWTGAQGILIDVHVARWFEVPVVEGGFS